MQQNFKKYGGKVLQYFLQGVIVIAPLGITMFAVVWLFEMVDNILPSITHKLFPSIVGIDAEGNFKKIPGLGFIIVISVVVITGWLSSSFFMGKLVALLDTVLENTPGIKFIYTAVKDFLEAFAGNKKKFDKAVLVNIDSADVWRIGFVTQASAQHFGMENHLVVYVPHSYAISGITYIVPKEKVKPLYNTTAAEAMKFTVTGGVTDIE
jgi:uncharacterized membrane protein